jgi:hypothetical protein
VVTDPWTGRVGPPSTCSDCPKNIPGRGRNLSVLTLGGGNVGTGTPMGSMVFTVMAALAQMELENGNGSTAA